MSGQLDKNPKSVVNVRWYCHYPLSYKNSEEEMLERGLEADHSTINRRGLNILGCFGFCGLNKVKTVAISSIPLSTVFLGKCTPKQFLEKLSLFSIEVPSSKASVQIS
ncbi:hypothetical protein [Acaryochloris sp. IP29b_bin.137]|uniref:hypothetical protein n=1 Tax=Acaryochloris sp. IP29b_bin.137 TaxID=2969217 RepID=UPI00261BB411|nr:hypothetical protein [Acaryochloris sp. IP29b_bin.137]